MWSNSCFQCWNLQQLGRHEVFHPGAPIDSEVLSGPTDCEVPRLGGGRAASAAIRDGRSLNDRVATLPEVVPQALQDCPRHPGEQNEAGPVVLA
jgi:hypothetical protein